MRKLRSLLLPAVALSLCATAAAKAPPFCAPVRLPPAACDAPAALPCDEKCGRDQDNNLGGWNAYWERCGFTHELTLEQKRFMCAAPAAGRLHVVFFNPALQWVCCTKNPFSDGAPD
jgi:hypothetical protein